MSAGQQALDARSETPGHPPGPPQIRRRPAGLESNWVDIPYGVHAFTRADGEVVVFIEENTRGKIHILRTPPAALRVGRRN